MQTGSKALRTFSFILCLAAFCVFLFIFSEALISTAFVDAHAPGGNETVSMSRDNPIFGVAALLCFAATLFLFSKLLRRVPLPVLCAALFTFTAVFGVIYILSAKAVPSFDSASVVGSAGLLANGDGAELTTLYFEIYPFQLGLTYFYSLLLRLFPAADGVTLLSCVNVIFLCFTQLALIKLSGLITDTPDAPKLTALLLFLSPQALLYVTFCYGILPAMPFAFFALYFLCLFFRNGKARNGLLCALMLFLAVLFKYNSMLFLVVAIAAFLIFAVLRRSSRRTVLLSVLCAALCVFAALAARYIPVLLFYRDTGVLCTAGMPAQCYLSLGLSDDGLAPGWYNAKYTINRFIGCGMDPQITARDAMTDVRESFSGFLSDPGYAVRFFTVKLCSQFNEPTFGSIWVTDVRSTSGTPGALAAFVCGSGTAALTLWMRCIHITVCFFALAEAFFLLRGTLRPAAALLLAVFLCGFCYHALFEAKSQYALIYYIAMIPLACGGVTRLSYTLQRIPLRVIRKGGRKA